MILLKPRPKSEEGGLRIARFLWGTSSKPLWLFGAAVLLLLAMLGSRQLWTHEGRWAVICQEMLRSGDFLHPYLYDQPYYDKPLLSYWLMIGFARVFAVLNEWALRLPSALSGVLAVWCTYRLGRHLFGRPAGLLAGWILVTCFYFVFWGRVAGSDMLNVAGTVAAVVWFFERKNRPSFVFYGVFFSIMALTSLTKGLIGLVVPLLVLLPPLLSGQEWRKHLRASLFLAVIPAILLYLLPFILSSASGGKYYKESGLAMVFRENFVRFFQPFDHKGHILTYFKSLPLYMLPWSIFLPFAIWRAVRQWKSMNTAHRWPVWASLLIFGFLTASGSRRGYYILPILPFAALVMADWIMAGREEQDRRHVLAAWLSVPSALLMLAWFGLVQPYLESFGGLRLMAKEVHGVLESKAPLPDREVVVYGIPPMAAYYLSLSKTPHDLGNPSKECLIRLKAFLIEKPGTLVLTKKEYHDDILPYLLQPTLIQEKPRLPRFLRNEKTDGDAVIAFIPSFEEKSSR